MIIGSGFIAKNFNDYSKELEKLNICIYAAGVSNSQIKDNDLLVINKPSGMVTHPAPGNQNNTLVNALLYYTKNNLSSIQESPLTMLIPSCLLAIGAIITGILFKEMFIGSDTQFWSSSILFLQSIQHDRPPFWLFVITPTIVIITIPIAYYLFVANEKILKNFVLKNQVLYNFLVNKWYFDELYNFIFVEPLKKIGLFFWKKGDINTIDRYGPDGLSRLVKIISDKAVHFQSGYLYHYAFVMLIGFSILLTYLILY